MYLGPALNKHAPDCFEMWGPVTGYIHVTRDVIWLKRMCFEKHMEPKEIGRIQDIAYIAPPPDDEDDAISVAGAESNDADDKEEVVAATGQENTTEPKAAATTTTSSGRHVRPPSRLIEEMGGAGVYEIKLTEAETSYYATMRELGELAFVGVGLGGGFANTAELKVMKYYEAMASEDRSKWKQAVEEEYRNLCHYKVFKPVPKDQLPHGAKVLTPTWAMKKKASGRYKARLNARGYEQIDGVHDDSNDKAAPVAGNMTVMIMLVLMIMAGLLSELLDVKGAFLSGRFAEAAIAFWKETQHAFKSMNYNRSKADPCLHYRWYDDGVVLWISWVDDYLVVGPKGQVDKAKKEMMERFNCDEVGVLWEYVGCKTDYDKDGGRLKFTQPVRLQSFVDEFDLPEGQNPTTPAIPGSILMPVAERNLLPMDEQTKYRSGVGKLLHMMRWSRQDILNAVRELSKFMSGASKAHMVAMERVMKYCMNTSNRGLELKPTRKWDGVNRDFKFRIKGVSDSEYAKDASRKSINGRAVFLEGAPVSMKSKMMPIVALSVTEAELFAAGVQYAQDMMHAMRILESIGLKSKTL